MKIDAEAVLLCVIVAALVGLATLAAVEYQKDEQEREYQLCQRMGGDVIRFEGKQGCLVNRVRG